MPGLTRKNHSPCHDMKEIEEDHKVNFLKIIIMLNNEDKKGNKLKRKMSTCVNFLNLCMDH